MKNSFLFNSLTVLRIYIFRKYGPNTLNRQQPIQVSLSRRWGDRSFQSSASCTLFYIWILVNSLYFFRFHSSLPFRTPKDCSFLPHPPPFLLSSQPPIFPHLLILVVLQKPLSQIWQQHFPSSVTIFQLLSIHRPPQPPVATHIALHPGELNTQLHVVHLSWGISAVAASMIHMIPSASANAPRTVASARV